LDTVILSSSPTVPRYARPVGAVWRVEGSRRWPERYGRPLVAILYFVNSVESHYHTGFAKFHLDGGAVKSDLISVGIFNAVLTRAVDPFLKRSHLPYGVKFPFPLAH